METQERLNRLEETLYFQDKMLKPMFRVKNAQKMPETSV